jgi:hypothetical protein
MARTSTRHDEDIILAVLRDHQGDWKTGQALSDDPRVYQRMSASPGRLGQLLARLARRGEIERGIRDGKRIYRAVMRPCSQGHQPGQQDVSCCPPADPADAPTRLLRAIYGLCPDCDRTEPHSHGEPPPAAGWVRTYTPEPGWYLEGYDAAPGWTVSDRSIRQLGRASIEHMLGTGQPLGLPPLPEQVWRTTPVNEATNAELLAELAYRNAVIKFCKVCGERIASQPDGTCGRCG